MTEHKGPQVEVELHPNGTGKIVIDGKDVSNYVGAVDIKADASWRKTMVTLSLPHVAHVFANTTQADVDSETANMLILLGWMSRDVAASHHAALCEALDLTVGDASGYPTWDEIIDTARELKARMRGLEK